MNASDQYLRSCVLFTTVHYISLLAMAILCTIVPYMPLQKSPRLALSGSTSNVSTKGRIRKKALSMLPPLPRMIFRKN